MYGFGSNMHWAAIPLITLPRQAFVIGGDQVKGQTLGVVLLIGAFVSMVVAPLFGALSARTALPFGRRRPWIIAGTMMNVLGLFGLAYFPRGNDLSSFFGTPVVQNAETAVSIFFLPLLFGAIASSLAAEILCDRFGRKLMLYLSRAFQAIVPIFFIFFPPFGIVVALGLVFGLGYGAGQAADWALASDVLPSETDYAKDMGVWRVAFTFPQVISTPIAGFLLDRFQVVGRLSGSQIAATRQSFCWPLFALRSAQCSSGESARCADNSGNSHARIEEF